MLTCDVVCFGHGNSELVAVDMNLGQLHEAEEEAEGKKKAVILIVTHLNAVEHGTS